jgi:hypothetical protein
MGFQEPSKSSCRYGGNQAYWLEPSVTRGAGRVAGKVWSSECVCQEENLPLSTVMELGALRRLQGRRLWSVELQAVLPVVASLFVDSERALLLIGYGTLRLSYF